MNLIKIEKSIMFHLYLFLNVLFYICESELVYECKKGFSHFGNNCYHLSLKPATWQEAYFECNYMTKGSKLAVLLTEMDDFNLRTFFLYKYNATEERWIGGIYDWSKDHWKWAKSGHKMRYQNFKKIPHFENPQDDHWKCAAINPKIDSRWTAHNCIEKKHYVCEAKPQPECK